MSKEELTKLLNEMYNIQFTDIYWEIDKEGEGMIMLDDSIGNIPDNIWEICYKSGFQEDENGDKISILNQNKNED